MSVWPNTGQPQSLFGSEGELVSVRVSIEPRLLECLLDALAHLEFPINPEIWHGAGGSTEIEFPAWSSRIPELRDALARAGFDSGCAKVTGMLEEIRAERAIA